MSAVPYGRAKPDIVISSPLNWAYMTAGLGLDDDVWDERGNMLTPAGKILCEFLVTRLTSVGYRCTEPCQHKFYGWAFNIIAPAAEVWCMVQGHEPGGVYIVFEPRRRLIATVLGKDRWEGCLGLLRDANAALGAVPELTSLRWYNHHGLFCRERGPGAESPI